MLIDPQSAPGIVYPAGTSCASLYRRAKTKLLFGSALVQTKKLASGGELLR
jgi:hypothetical protein